MKGIILTAFALLFMGCGEEEISPDRTVHLAGYVMTPTNNTVVSYWKDNIYKAVSDPTRDARASSMFVNRSSVLIGARQHFDNSQARLTLWRDDEETIIENGFGGTLLVAVRGDDLYGIWFEIGSGWLITKNGNSQRLLDTAFNYQPAAMVLVGNDLHVCGASVDPATPDEVPYSYQHAQYWKNGQLLFRENEVSYANSIFVDQNDVYMAGIVYSYNEPNIPCYWKNGQRVQLAASNPKTYVKSIFVSDGQVYVAGMIDDQAVYWKDGTVTFLTNAGTNSMANSIVVKDGDVHVGGMVQGYPAYWKNDVRQDIPNQDKRGQVEFVMVGSN